MKNGQPKYDLLLKGGHVIDPANEVDAPLDVAVSDGQIAAVAQEIPSTQAGKVVDVTGLYVTPGLIDMHVHVFGYGGSMYPDEHALRDGVTTLVDAGGAGWKNFEEFKTTIIDRFNTRILAFLNIVGAGMLGAVEQDVGEMEPIPAAETIKKHPDVLIGMKTAHFGGTGWEAVDRAVEAGVLSDTPVMIDFSPRPTRSYSDLLLKHMRPGDMHTHMYAKHIPLLNEQGQVNEYMWEARDRGVIFDVGHGAGSFWFRVAVPALEQGFGPDSISTDLHRNSAMLPNATLTQTMSKFLNMGMPLDEIILRTTVTPAQEIGRPELGTLSVGACADVTVLDIKEGAFGFVDSGHAKLLGSRRIGCAMTVRAGRIAWDLDGLSWPEWKEAGDYAVIQ